MRQEGGFNKFDVLFDASAGTFNHAVSGPAGAQDAFAINLSPACSADLDGDGDTDFEDFSLLVAGWGSPAADLDGDATTDFADFNRLVQDWGCGADG